MPDADTVNDTDCPALVVTLVGAIPETTGGKLLTTSVATALVADPEELVRIAKYPAASPMATLLIVRFVVEDPEMVEPETVTPSKSRLVVPPDILYQRLLATGFPGFAVNVNFTVAPGLVAISEGVMAEITGLGVTVNETTLLVAEPLAFVRMAKKL